MSTVLSPAERQHLLFEHATALTAKWPHPPYAPSPNPDGHWRSDRNDDLMDSQVGDLPTPEPEPLQRDLFL